MIDDAGGAYPFTTGVENFKEFFYGAAQQAGESQNFDGNGSYVRFQVGGGPIEVSAPQPGGGFENTAVYGNTFEPPIGTRPAQAPKPPYKPKVACHTNAVPDVNGRRTRRPAEPGRTMNRAIREHLRDFVAIIALFVIGIVATVVILINQGVPFPSWAPGVGSESFELKAEFTSAQAVTPGQGQTVNINGVKVGEITEVELEDGRAIVTM